MYARLIAVLLLGSSACALHEQAVKRAQAQKLEEEQERKKYSNRIRCENASSVGSHMMDEACTDVDQQPAPSGEPAAAAVGLTGPQQLAHPLGGGG